MEMLPGLSYGLFPFLYLERARRMIRGDVAQVEYQNGLRNPRRSRQVGMEHVHVRSQATAPCTEDRSGGSMAKRFVSRGRDDLRPLLR
jgi:hypothetical protein